jgi:hypothetical protein
VALTATLYRHWLELRSPLRIVAVPGGILLALADMVMLLSWGGDSALHVHGACSVLAALLAGITCGGSGVRTTGLMPGHPSISYTLTLPVPRFRLIWTRSVAGVLAGAAFPAPIFVATLLFWAFADSSFSIRAVVTISLMCGLVVIVTQAIFALVLPLWSESLGIWAVMVAFIAIVYSPAVRSSWSTGVTSIVPPVSPVLIGVLVLIAVLSLPLASFIAARRDF